MAWTQHNPLPLCLLSPLWPPGRTKPCRVLNAFSDCIWTWVLSWLTRKQLWAHGVVSVCCHHAQGGIAPRGPRSPGQRGTKTPAHLVQLQLSQDVRRHSIPDSHNLWKARERGVRLRASQLTASRQAPRPGGDRCRCPQPAQTNTARGSAQPQHHHPRVLVAASSRTLGGELEERGEQAAQLQADGHAAAALHRACRLPSAQEKGCSLQLLAQNSSLTCPCSSASQQGPCLSARVPQRSPAASRPCSWLWSSSKGQWWGAPELCPAAPRPRREVPALPWYRGDLPVM